MVSSRMNPKSPWLVRLLKSAEPRLRLVCLPDVGESAWDQRDLVDVLPADIELFAVDLPGRGLRRSEPPVPFEVLRRELGEALREELLDEPAPVVFFGRGLGASLALELTRWLQDAALPTPVRLILGGVTRAPTQRDLGVVQMLEQDHHFARCLERLSLGDVSLEGVQADIELLRRTTPRGPKIDVPITWVAEPHHREDEAQALVGLTTEGLEVLRVRGGLRVLGGRPLREALLAELALSGPPAACFHHVA